MDTLVLRLNGFHDPKLFSQIWWSSYVDRHTWWGLGLPRLRPRIAGIPKEFSKLISPRTYLVVRHLHDKVLAVGHGPTLSGIMQDPHGATAGRKTHQYLP